MLIRISDSSVIVLSKKCPLFISLTDLKDFVRVNEPDEKISKYTSKLASY